MFPKKYQAIAVAFLLILTAIIMVSYGTKPDSQTGFVRKLVLETAMPLVSLKNAVLGALKENWHRYIFLVGLEERNRHLMKENALMAQQLGQYRESRLEAMRLKRLLELRDPLDARTVAATVIDRDPSPVAKTVLINRGSSQGLRAGLPVLADRGIAGRITECSWHMSRVMLITDPSSNVDALIQGTRAHGILQGTASGGCHLKYISKTEEVQVGDSVVTSGLGRIFPKGIVLGAIKSVDKTDGGLFQKIEVVPAVHFNRLEEVLVPIFHESEGQ